MSGLTASIVAVVFLFVLTTGNEAAAEEANPNRFNRLLPTKEQRTPPLARDGVHDATNPGIDTLQQPSKAFQRMEPGQAGNYVDWVKTLRNKRISPRYDVNDPSVEPVTMDLDIVREVKGSTPDVIYPHKAHTEWLDCSNCHPAIFIPQKGANPISMSEIILGQKCGVCHGKVAFPVTECRRCHSKPKPEVTTTNTVEDLPPSKL